MKLSLPKEINKYVDGLNYNLDNVGRSEDKVIIFENKYVLKISRDIKRLKREKDINEWLDGKTPGPKNIAFVTENNLCYYLRTALNGYSLIDDRYINNPNLLIDCLSKAITLLRELEKYNCEYLSFESSGKAFTHGDLCLPNIYFDENNNFIGFIDLSGAGLGDPWQDYSWMLWSLEYNLGTNKYHQILLDKINVKFDEEKYNEFIPEEYR